MTDLAERLARYSYKPGWRLDLCLRIRATVPDSRNPGQTTPIQSIVDLPEGIEDWSDDKLDGWLEKRFIFVESHEVREWLRRDGLLVNDPHGEAK